MAIDAVQSPVSLPRFFAPEGAALVRDAVVALSEEELRHARVRRLKEGARVVLLDGRGGSAEGVLRSGAVHLEEVRADVGEPPHHITLLLSCAEPVRLEWAVEKGTECGASRFLLVVAARSQLTHVKAVEARLDRFRRITREAVKQCGRSRVPDVEGPFPLGEGILVVEAPLLFASPSAPLPAEPVGNCSIVIGPEGGFAPDEEALLEAAGATPFGLGPRTLRLETAAVTALALLLRGR